MAGEGARIIGVAHHTCGQAEHCARRQIGVARKPVGAGDFVPEITIAIELSGDGAQGLPAAHGIAPGATALIIGIKRLVIAIKIDRTDTDCVSVPERAGIGTYDRRAGALF